MPRVFRVFISSTFNDFHAERNYLQERVFPDIQQHYQAKGVRFQAIDLRWGVNQEAGIDQRTLAICQEEVRRCRDVSPDFCFIALIGERYGTILPPETIPASLFERLSPFMTPPERDLLGAWYLEDSNARDPIYALQRRTGSNTDKDVWLHTAQAIIDAFQRAIQGAQIAPLRVPAFFASATEIEIIQGLFDPPASAAPLCFARTILHAPATGATVARFIDSPNTDSWKKLQALKKRMNDAFPQAITPFDATWGDIGPTDDHLPSFGDLTRDAIIARIDAVLAATPPGEEVTEIAATATFTAARLKDFSGDARAADLQTIRDYLARRDANPLLVTGPAGSGKSTLLAKAAEEARGAYPTAEIVAVYIGVTAGSTTTQSLLELMARQISAAYQISAPIPTDENGLIQDLPTRLAAATADRPIILIIDALDQLRDQGRAGSWLPSPLPDHAHLICSLLPGAEEAALRALVAQYPQADLVTLRKLTREDGRQILAAWLRDAGRALQPEQEARVLDGFTPEGLPLYLKLAFEDARHWPSYARDMGPLATDIPGMLNDLFTRLAQPERHIPLLVDRALAYLGAARDGLAEDEIIACLSADDAVLAAVNAQSARTAAPQVNRVPFVLWSRLAFDLAAYVTERRIDGAALIGFYHQQVAAVVNTRYLAGDAGIARHRFLAARFNRRAALHDAPPDAVPDLRMLAELPFQQTRGELWDDLYATLTDMAFLTAKAATGAFSYHWIPEYTFTYYRGLNALQTDVADAIRAWPSDLIKRDQSATLVALDQAFDQESATLVRFPELLWQQVYNRLRWSAPDSASRLAVNEPRQFTQPPVPWIRLLNPPQTSPLLIRSFTHAPYEGVKDTTRFQRLSAAISPDERLIVSSSQDQGTLMIFDAQTGREIRHMQHGRIPKPIFTSDSARCIAPGARTEDPIEIYDTASWRRNSSIAQRLPDNVAETLDTFAAALHPNDEFLAVCSNNLMMLINLVTGEQRPLTDLADPQKRHTNDIQAVAFSPRGDLLVSGDNNSMVIAWDVATWEPRWKKRIGFSMVHAIAVHPSSASLVVGLLDGEAHIVHAATGTEIGMVTHMDGGLLRPGVTDCAIDPTGKMFITCGADGMIKLWDLATRELRYTYTGHTQTVQCCAFTRSGAQIFSAGSDGMIGLWNAQPEAANAIRKGHTDRITACAISPNGRFGATASEDKTLIVWDLEQPLGKLRRLKGHRKEVVSCGFSPDSSVIFSGDEAGTITLWEVASGRQLESLSTSFRDWPPNAIQSNADGSGLIAAVHSTMVCYAARGQDRKIIGQHDDVNGCAYAPDGSWLISASDDHTVRVYDAMTYEPLATLTDSTSGVKYCASSPGGDFIVAATEVERYHKNADHLFVWDTREWRLRWSSPAHAFEIVACAVSPDGASVITASRDAAITVWDAQTGSPRATFHAPNAFTCLALHPWLPQALGGGEGGLTQMIAFAGLTYGPILVTPIQRDGAPSIRCPKCQTLMPIQPDQFGHNLPCANATCALALRVGPIPFISRAPTWLAAASFPPPSPPAQPLKPKRARPIPYDGGAFFSCLGCLGVLGVITSLIGYFAVWHSATAIHVGLVALLACVVGYGALILFRETIKQASRRIAAEIAASPPDRDDD